MFSLFIQHNISSKMSENIANRVSLALIKSLVCIYDIISFPVYYLVQKPYKTIEKWRALKATQIDPNNPYSPWVRVQRTQKHFIDECETVDQLFARAVETYGEKRCFGFRTLLREEDELQSGGKVFRKKVLSDYSWLSFRETEARVQDIARGLLWSGIKPGDNVLILCETRVEWMLSCQALFSIGATVATLYTTLGDDGLVHGMNETEITHMITSHDLLAKIARLEPRLEFLKTIIFIEGNERSDTTFVDKTLIAFSLLETRGRESQHLRGEKAKPNDTAVLMYTSGSTGIPKAVMISHKNLLRATQAFFTIAHALSEKDVYCGYLPLAHVLEMAAELFFFSLGMSVGFATPLTLTDKSTGLKRGCRGDCVLLRPTVMACVPLVLDRIRKAINEDVEARGSLFKSVFHFAIDYKKFWTKKGFKTPIVNALICRKIKAMLGGNVRLMAAGSAPLAPETHEFIRACLDLDLLQGYGLTETSASATLMDLHDLSVGRVGTPLAGVQIKLVDWVEGNYRVQDKPHPRGEVVVGGENITRGYFKNESLTKEAYRREEGVDWFYTGDIGEVFPDGTLKIIDRKKDLVKLQFGEYVSLGKVEAELKSSPFVDNICVYGDSFHDYLVALIQPNAKAVHSLAHRLNKDTQSLSELCRDADILEHVCRDIREFGVRSRLHKMEIPTKMKLCSEEWLPDSGLVTAALKLRRKQIQDFYQMDINRMYDLFDLKST